MLAFFQSCKPILLAISFLVASHGSACKDADQGTNAVSVEKHGGVVYKKGNGFELKCDVFEPDIRGKRPAIIIVHGGGWRAGSKVLYQSHASKMARRGYVVMCINYRHAPAYQFSHQVSDLKTAIRWMKHHAVDYSVDENRIGIWGYSAGGHLAAMAATTDKGDDLDGEIPGELQIYDSRIKAVAIGGAPCDIESYPVDSRMLYFWLKATRRENPERYRRASPLTYVSADDPPFFVFHGKLDKVVLPALSASMHEKLKQAGVQSEYRIYKKYGHTGVFWYQVGLDDSIDFFDSILKK